MRLKNEIALTPPMVMGFFLLVLAFGTEPQRAAELALWVTVGRVVALLLIWWLAEKRKP